MIAPMLIDYKELETQHVLSMNTPMENTLSYKILATNLSHELQEARQGRLEDEILIDQLRKQNEELKATLKDHEAATSRSITLLGNLLHKGSA